MMRLISHSLCRNYVPLKIRRNLMLQDHAATRWLREHPEIRLVDCDKGMGDCLCDRSWLAEQLLVSSREAGDEIEETDLKLHHEFLKDRFGLFALQAFEAGALSAKHHKEICWALRNCKPAGFARIIVKVHKKTQCQTHFQHDQHLSCGGCRMVERAVPEHAW